MAEKGSLWMERVEIDTSVPFQSVKEAVDLFGGSGSWKPQRSSQMAGSAAEMHPCFEENIPCIEDQSKQLQNDIVVREQETLEVLKEIESTNNTMDGLKLKLQSQSSEATISSHRSLDSGKMHPVLDNEDEVSSNRNPVCSSRIAESSKLMLMDLKKAKAILNMRMNDLTGYQSSIEVLKDGMEDENPSLDNIHESTTKMSFLEKELTKTRLMLDQTRMMLQITKDAEDHNLVGQNAGELCKERNEAEMVQVEEANVTKRELLKKVEEARADIINSKKALEEAIQMFEASHRGKLADDRTRPKRRPRHGRRRHPIHRSRFKNSPTFKKFPFSKQHRRDLQMCDGCEDVSKSTPSIGQILRRKLMGSEEFVTTVRGGPGVSLREMLNIQRALSSKGGGDDAITLKQLQVKKKFGFGRFSLLLPKP